MSIVFFEGAFMPESEARIPVADRGFQYGDGAFATIQVRDGHPFFLSTHLKRLEEQCRLLGISIKKIDPLWISELIRLNFANEGVWRLKVIVSGGDSHVNHLPLREGRLLMILMPFEVPVRQPLRMGVFPYPVSVCHSSFKSLAHLNRFYVMEKAREKRLDDCITLTENRMVLESAFGNLFWVLEKTVFTPCKSLPIYFGVTITNALNIASSLGYEIQYVKTPLEKLPQEACFFRTNTMGGIRPIIQIESMHVPYNEKLDQLFLNGYEDLIHGGVLASS